MSAACSKAHVAGPSVPDWISSVSSRIPWRSQTRREALAGTRPRGDVAALALDGLDDDRRDLDAGSMVEGEGLAQLAASAHVDRARLVAVKIAVDVTGTGLRS